MRVWINLVIACVFLVSNAFYGRAWTIDTAGIQTAADISIRVVQPAERALVGNELRVVAMVNSLYELKSVNACVEKRETDLEFSDRAYRDESGDYHPGWVGSISLSGLARGEKQLVVTATDVFGGTAEEARSFIYDQKPILDVQEPLADTVARPQLRIAVTCTDDDPAGCVSVTVRVLRGGAVIATGQSRIDQTVSLAAYEGMGVILRFEALDSAGQWTYESRTVFVESSTRLSEVESVGGRILDVQPDRILFLEPSGTMPVLKILDRSSGEETVVMEAPDGVQPYGFLTPKGAIFVAGPLYDWREGRLVNLGVPDSQDSLKVQGNYAIWSRRTTLFVRDLVSGANTEMSTRLIGNWRNDVAANGDVVYWTTINRSDYNIFRYRNGVSTRLTNDRDLWNTYPLTDGINVAYRKSTPCCVGQRYEIAMYGEAGEVILARARSQEPIPSWDYQLNEGWVAFTRPGVGGSLQVWILSPWGKESQITYFGSSSRIDALGSDGEVVFRNGNRLYLGGPDTPTIAIGSVLGRSFWQDDKWLVVIGRSLFEVDTAE